MNPTTSNFATEMADAPTITVLLVDDQIMVAEVVRRLLASETDIAFHYCTNAVEAIDLANQIRPAVILQDLIMPNVNGLAMVRRFRANLTTKTTPIVVLSSKDDPIFKQDALTSGANDYLVKLPDPAVLVACIRKHAQIGSEQSNSPCLPARTSVMP